MRTNNWCLRFKRNFSWYEQRYFAPLFIRNMQEFKRSLNETQSNNAGDLSDSSITQDTYNDNKK